MKAIILAAGLGTRLKPLTDELPKAMLPLKDKPLLYYQINWSKKYGITDIAINLHHLPEKIRSY
jgi:NDP-sugar pyrophosphorylase family protein